MLVVLIPTSAAVAAPGDLDPTFSGDGRQTTDVGRGPSSAAAVVRQPDGKIVATGRTAGSFGGFAVARYKADGSLDTAFSGDGRQTTSFGQLGLGSGSEAVGVALQADGKIVAVGTASAFGLDFAVVRYNPDGSLDTTFSGDGKQTTDFEGYEGANDVAVQPDGKIVVVGSTFNSPDPNNFAIARYNADGSLDTTFSGDGKEETNVGDSAGAAGVAVQSDGKIVAAGTNSADLDSADFALVRYNPNGSLDTAFSGDGIQTTDFGGGFEQARDVALQGDGKIVAAGSERADFASTQAEDFALARYNTDGSLDTTFSGDGKQTTDFAGFGDRAAGLAVLGDGTIVAAGTTGTSGGSDFAAARYNTGGSLDTSFSGDGKQTTSFSFQSGASGVALLADGRVVAVGSSAFNGDFALVRYATDGSLDTSFSGDGKQTTEFSGADHGGGVTVQPDGKIVVVGETAANTTGRDIAVTRYHPDGSLDTGFSGDGKQLAGFDFGALVLFPGVR